MMFQLTSEISYHSQYVTLYLLFQSCFTFREQTPHLRLSKPECKSQSSLGLNRTDFSTMNIDNPVQIAILFLKQTYFWTISILFSFLIGDHNHEVNRFPLTSALRVVKRIINDLDNDCAECRITEITDVNRLPSY